MEHCTLQPIRIYGKEDLAYLYIAKDLTTGNILEFVESIQPPIPREKKWVIIISVLYGCPIGCKICDAGLYYKGKVSYKVLMDQIDLIIKRRFSTTDIPIEKLKIQFARMGEPTFNYDVLKVLKDLPNKYNAPGLIPCVSTVAPKNSICERFMEELITIKNEFYGKGKFQLQFSIHSTDQKTREELINKNIWNFKDISKFGQKWYSSGDRKITLNFAVSQNSSIDPKIIFTHFDPNYYFIKLTPINPTHNAIKNNIQSEITPACFDEKTKQYHILLEKEFKLLGYETLVSIGEWEENQIGTNCGQFASQLEKNESTYSTCSPLIHKNQKSYELENYQIYSKATKF